MGGCVRKRERECVCSEYIVKGKKLIIEFEG